MKRTEAVETMVEFYESIPEGASNYHKMDMLLSRLERLGVQPPIIYDESFYYYEWESENEEE